MTNDHEISTLNSLIATTIDSADGYAEAAKDADSNRFTTLFTDRSRERRTILTKLQAQVALIGGEPEGDGTVLAGAHRMFLSLKSVVMGNDDKAIVDEVERGEDHIKAKFEDALNDQELSPEVANLIRECFVSVKDGHDQMRDIKHAIEGKL